jgi:ornithine decarboxylase
VAVDVLLEAGEDILTIENGFYMLHPAHVPKKSNIFVPYNYTAKLGPSADIPYRDTQELVDSIRALPTPSLSSGYLYYRNEADLQGVIHEYLKNTEHPEESIYFLDLGEIERLYNVWQARFHGIQPYYAIKCNPDHGFIQKLAELGANFDCASIAEIDRVLQLGISPDRILFANPCKRKRDIVAAYQKGVRVVTFDTETELEKIATVCPQMRCMLRIYAKDPEASCQFAHKFGCPPERWSSILAIAANYDIQLVGASFHVGSGAKSPWAYSEAIRQARAFHDLAAGYGHKIHCIDIGGGFISHRLKNIPEVIQEAISKHFPPELGCRVIAEPGRYFAETSGILATNVIGMRKTDTTRDYWITDSLYGSFNCILYDKYVPDAEPITKSEARYKTTLYGPTCDGMDRIMDLEDFPELELNDWILFRKMGAYTLAAAACFNGIPFPNTHIMYLVQL